MPLSSILSQQQKSRAGFTLIEVIAAVAILAVGMTVILRYFLYVYSAVDTVETEVEAGKFLRSTLDQLIVELQANRTLGVEHASGDSTVNGHPAVWEWSYASVRNPGPGQENTTQLQEITLKLTWGKAGRNLELRRDAVIKEGT
jgi:prepilin-type N-terminal cleavage/methylation domain-containing protein